MESSMIQLSKYRFQKAKRVIAMEEPYLIEQWEKKQKLHLLNSAVCV